MLQWVGAAAAVGWGLLEAVDQFEDRDLLAPILYPLTLATVLTGIVATAVVAWFHGEKGDQSVHPAEIWILAALSLSWIGACTWILIR